MRPLTFDELKIQAKILRKSIQQGNPKELNRLSRFSFLKVKDIKLKDALNIVAIENGFSSWKLLKDFYSGLYGHPPYMSGYLNIWFRSYDEAKKAQADQGGYLFRIKKDFILVDENYLKSLGLEAEDPDLKLIGNDWARPNDLKAWNRLKDKIKKEIWL